MANLLIIDDDPLVCRMLSDFLKKAGHEVRTSGTLRGGLQENASTAFDVIFPATGGLIEKSIAH